MAKSPLRRSPRPAAGRPGFRVFLAIAIGMAALFTFLTGHVSVVAGRRTADGRVEGTLRTSFLRIVPLSETPLPGLRGAKLEKVVSRKTTLDSHYRVLLITDDGDIPMTTAASGGQGRHQALVDHITVMSTDPATEFFTVQHVAGGWFALAPAAVLLLLLIGLCLSAIVRRPHSVASLTVAS